MQRHIGREKDNLKTSIHVMAPHLGCRIKNNIKFDSLNHADSKHQSLKTKEIHIIYIIYIYESSFRHTLTHGHINVYVHDM